MNLSHIALQLTTFLSLPNRINGRGLQLFILLSVLGNVFVIGRTFQFFEYIFPTQFLVTEIVIKALLIIWLLISCLILYKSDLIYLSIIQLFFSAFMFRCFLTFGIFEITHLCMSWALLFCVVIKKYSGKPESQGFKFGVLGLFFTILFFGVVFFYAGIDKAIDPAWQKGIGFRQFIELEWVLLPVLQTFFLSSDLLLKVGNYFAILSECGFLIFIIFWKTRRIALFVYSILAFQLFFPFNIFLIGYFATIFAIPIFLLSFNKSEPLKFESNKYLNVSWGVMVVVIIGFFANMGITVLKSYVNRVYIKREYVEASIKPPSISEYEFSTTSLQKNYRNPLLEMWNIFHLYEIKNPYVFINNRLLRNGPIGLFSSEHTVGIFGYKLKFYDNNDNEDEPVVFFSNNGYRGAYDQEYFMLNVFQGSMYGISDLVYKMDYETEDEFETSVRGLYNKVIGPLIDISLIKNQNKNENYVKAVLGVYPLGKDCQGLNAWVDFVEVDLKSEKLLVKNLDTDNCYQGRHHRLNNYYQRIID